MTSLWWRRLSLVLFGVVVGSIGFWAWQAVNGRPPTETQSEPSLIYTVGVETLERSVPVIVVADRPRDPVAINLLDGMVTSVPIQDGPVEAGTVVYEVAGVPVRVVEGAVPFYREMGPGIAGDDVSQLQLALTQLGYLTTEPDGTFRASTSSAVRAWRRDLGLANSDRVALGELIAVPGLPRLLEVGEAIKVGRLVFSGTDAIFVFSNEAVFEAPVAESQAQTLMAASSLVVEHQGMGWEARISSSRLDAERGQIVLTLTGRDGGQVCGGECDLLPVGRVQLRAWGILIPPTTGPAVPVSALQTDAAGDIWVRLESGARRQIGVVAIAGGLAVVDGLEVGERVMIGGDLTPDADG